MNKMTKTMVDALVCPSDKDQAFLWCGATRGFGVRCTLAGVKSFVFQAAVGSEKLIPELPGVSAIAETIPAFASTAWFGIVATPGTDSQHQRRTCRRPS